jgi:hypothetical protein
MAFIKPVGGPMPDQGVDPLIQKKDLQTVSGRRVSGLNRLHVKPYILYEHLFPFYRCRPSISGPAWIVYHMR